MPDPVFRFIGRAVPEAGLLAIYRLAFFYGVGRWVSWIIWVHVLHNNDYDMTLGGPGWVQPLLMVLPILAGGCPACGGPRHL